VTEGALEILPPEELQAALAHELGHVELGHFAARSSRRETESQAKQQIDERATTGGAIAAAIPVIGPIIGLGIAGSHAAAQTATESTYRGYDQAEESAADRYAVNLLNRLPGAVPACRHLIGLLQRLDRERQAPLWSGWLSTHPSPAARLEAVKGLCG
jgi:Zn-dependent protease with chaperone function